MAITRHPASRAIRIAAVPTPPDAPVTSTVSPGCARATVMSARHAVSQLPTRAGECRSGHPRRDWLEVTRRHEDEIGMAAPTLLTEDAVPDAGRCLAAEAPLAAPAEKAGIDHHAIANPPIRDIGAERGDHSPRIGPVDVRKRWPGSDAGPREVGNAQRGPCD